MVCGELKTVHSKKSGNVKMNAQPYSKTTPFEVLLRPSVLLVSTTGTEIYKYSVIHRHKNIIEAIKRELFQSLKAASFFGEVA